MHMHDDIGHRKSKEWRTIGGPNAAQSGNQGKRKDHEDNHAENDKLT